MYDVAMYATDRCQTDRQTSDTHHRLMPPPCGGGAITMKKCAVVWALFDSVNLTFVTLTSDLSVCNGAVIHVGVGNSSDEFEVCSCTHYAVIKVVL